jgi:serine/threonine-protein kinase HipA
MSLWPAHAQGQINRHKAKMAMGILGKNKHYRFKDIQRRHFNNMALTHFQGQNAEQCIEQVLEQTPQAIANLRKKIPQGLSRQTAQSIFSGLLTSAQALKKIA